MSKIKIVGPFRLYKTVNVLFGGTQVICYGVEVYGSSNRANVSYTRIVRPISVD